MVSLTDFCIVAGTAAPIIALANVVAIGNAFSLVHFLRGRAAGRTKDRHGT
jgi:hypothetical protein